jgi:hypothetical protein
MFMRKHEMAAETYKGWFKNGRAGYTSGSALKKAPPNVLQ